MTSKPKWTPGEWIAWVIDREFGLLRIRDSNANVIATLSLDENRPAEETKANAHLIAAAPELVEALEYLHRWTSDVGGDEEFHRWRARARAALAKVRG